MVLEKYAFRGSKRPSTVLFDATAQNKKRKRNETRAALPARLDFHKRESLQFFKWGWKRSFDVQNSNLMLRYITEETDGKTCWTVTESKTPFVYIWYSKDGWFLLRQLFDVFLRPNTNRTLYYRRLMMKTRIFKRDELFGCQITRVASNSQGSLWKQLESAGVNTPWCICCDKIHPTGRNCKNIDLINLQSARKFVISQDAPCKNVLPLLETIVTLTRSNKRKRALTEADKQKIVMAQHCLCGECGKHLDHMEGYEVHHIFKLSEGGSNSCVNLLALCPSCHRVFSEKERNRPFTSLHRQH